MRQQSSRLTSSASTARPRGRALVAAALVSLTAAATPAQAGLLGGLLGTVTGVVGVVTSALDTTVGLLGGADWGYAPTVTRLPEVADAVNADQLWARGITGSGVGVALVDTGVVPVTGLTSGNVVNGPDLSFESQSPTPYLDGYGHGTHLAGIIAGNDGTAGGYRGIAPDSTLLSVRVGAHDGAADVSQVIAAIDWVVQHRNDNGMNIRVLNLAYGTDGTQSPAMDPLTHAVENAWRAGIVVVVSGGNGGNTRPSVDNPARDPYVIAVGADDTRGTAGAGDDVIPSFSTRGSLTRRVDVVAPGQSIASLRDPGSYVDTEYPGAVVDGRFFKGSGTSQAAAVVSGAVALLLDQRPGLTPDQVKALLRSTASPMLLADSAGRGAGEINLAAAGLAQAPTGTQSWAPSTGTGSIEAARGSQHVADGDVDLTGERDVLGPWDAGTWAASSRAGTSWVDGRWNGRDWTGGCWCTPTWAGMGWSPVDWSGQSWSGRSWSGRSWSGRSWSGRSWSGDGWSGRSWSGRSWSGRSWS